MNYEYSEFTLIAVTAMAVMPAHTEENNYGHGRYAGTEPRR